MINYLDHHFRPAKIATAPALAIYTTEFGTDYVCPIFTEGGFKLKQLYRTEGRGHDIHLCPLSVGRVVSKAQVTELMEVGHLQLPEGRLKICRELTALRLLAADLEAKRWETLTEVEDLIPDEAFNDVYTQADVWAFLNSRTWAQLIRLEGEINEYYDDELGPSVFWFIMESSGFSPTP